MRKALLMAGVLLALAATAASAAPGVDLAWTQCRGKTGATTARTLACTATTGVAGALYASVNPPAGVNQLEGAEIYIDYQESGGALSCWWNFTGPSRSASLVVLPLAPTDINSDVTIICGAATAQPYTPLADGSDGYYFTVKPNSSGGGGAIVTGANSGQLKGIVAIPAGSGSPVPADVQQYACGFRITNAGTGPSCLGCQDGVTLTLSLVRLTQPGLPNVDITNANLGNSISWNGGFTRTASKTWGAVKALYRN